MIAELLQNQFLIFTLVLGRVGGLLLTAPVFSTTAIPLHIRGILAVAVSVMLVPLHVGSPSQPSETMLDVGMMLASEIFVGLLLGFGMAVLMSGIQVAGQLISQLSGMSLAEVFNPGLNTNVPMFGQLFYYVTMAVFVLVDGHRMIIQALLDTFVAMPPGEAVFGDSFVDALTTTLTQSFVLGIRAAAPVMAALLVSTLVLGLITRTLPQINIIAVGFSLNALLTLAGVFMSLGAIAWTFQEQTAATLRLLTESLGI